MNLPRHFSSGCHGGEITKACGPAHCDWPGPAHSQGLAAAALSERQVDWRS